MVPCKSRRLRASTNWSGLVAKGSQAERSMDVPRGRSGVAAGIVEKITRLTKLSRRKDVSDEKSANSGPRTLSPGTLADGGKKLKTDGALNKSSFISAEPMAEPPTFKEFNTPSLVALNARRILVM